MAFSAGTFFGNLASGLSNNLQGKPAGKRKSPFSKGGGSQGSTQQTSTDTSSGNAGELASYHKGGVVRKTGPARLRKGEIVLTKGQAREAVKRIRGHRRGRGRGHGRSGKKR